MENVCDLMNEMEEEMSAANNLIVDEGSEVKNVCDLMNAIFFEAVAREVRKLCKENCRSCEVDHPSQRRHECLMLTEEERWFMNG